MTVDTGSIGQFREACRMVLRKCPDEYAKSYASAGLTLVSLTEVKAQSLYILSNMTKWRGEDAAVCRQVFKAFGNQK